MSLPPFAIKAGSTCIAHDPAGYRDAFASDQALCFDGVIDPAFLEMLVSRAAAAAFMDDNVDRIGLRAIEARQRVGPVLSMALGRHNFLEWLMVATGVGPLRAVAGRLAQTRANGCDELDWHDDLDDLRRRLGMVINLSDTDFDGGTFEMRRKGETESFLRFQHSAPGSMLVFAVHPQNEHRVTPLTSGGPRRVFAGWAMTRPEFDGDPLARSADL